MKAKHSTKWGMVLAVTITVLLLAACGPTAEELTATAQAAATQTAAAAPTPTSTPIPFDLKVKISDAAGNLLAGVTVKLNELGEAPEALQTSNDAGEATWANLPGENVTLKVSAQGYFSKDAAQTLQRGPNEMTVALERDPFGLLTQDACAAGETLIYAEDFQDKAGQGWPEIEFNAAGWTIEADPASEGNTILVARQGAPWTWYNRDNISLDNAVWRITYQYTGQAISHFNFRFVETAEESARYMYVGGAFSHLQRLQKDIPAIQVKNFSVPKKNEWRRLEFAYFNGVVTIWLDGKELLVYNDPQPWTGGTINLEPYPQSETEYFFYDNISLCGLTAPFQSISTPTP